MHHRYKPWLIALLIASISSISCKNDHPVTDEENPDERFTEPIAQLSEIQDRNGHTYKVGFVQASSINQNPFVEKVDANGNRIWRHTYEESPVDSRAIFVSLDCDDRPFVVFSVDGGSNDAEAIQRFHSAEYAFDLAPFPSYGQGGGPKVILIARLNPTNGQIERATFLLARLTDGRTNTINPLAFQLVNCKVYIDVQSAAWPQAAGSTHRQNQRFNPELFNDSNRPPLRYQLPSDLSELTDVWVTPDP